jgi:hypothetical protein
MTRNKFFCFTEKNFAILSDEETILGVYGKKKNNIILKENIKDRSKGVQAYIGNSHVINSILVHEDLDTFLAAECNNFKGKIIQYSLSSGKILKEYTNLNIGSIVASKKVNTLFFFGGSKGSFTVIDIKARKVLITPIITAVREIKSMEVFPINLKHKKIVLAVVGYFPDYSTHLTDLFDVTDLIAKHKCLRYFY